MCGNVCPLHMPILINVVVDTSASAYYTHIQYSILGIEDTFSLCVNLVVALRIWNMMYVMQYSVFCEIFTEYSPRRQLSLGVEISNIFLLFFDNFFNSRFQHGNSKYEVIKMTRFYRKNTKYTTHERTAYTRILCGVS